MSSPLKAMQSHGVQLLTATEREAGQRLDNALFRLFKTLPKSRLYRLMRKGELRVNKKRVNPDYRLMEGDIIRVPPLDLVERETEVLKLNSQQLAWAKEAVIAEEADFLVVNKPVGLSVHAGSDTKAGVIEILRLARPDLKFIELAHRLDRDTSGCLLIAKKPSALKVFHKMLRERDSIQKTYLLQVKGLWPKRLNRVDFPIEGKASLTTFQIVEAKNHTTKLKAILHTGRQHQIRIHCQKAGFPIIGDAKYGDFTFNREYAKQTGIKRMFLHALKLEFVWQDEKYQFTAEASF